MCRTFSLIFIFYLLKLMIIIQLTNHINFHWHSVYKKRSLLSLVHTVPMNMPVHSGIFLSMTRDEPWLNRKDLWSLVLPCFAIVLVYSHSASRFGQNGPTMTTTIAMPGRAAMICYFASKHWLLLCQTVVWPSSSWAMSALLCNTLWPNRE